LRHKSTCFTVVTAHFGDIFWVSLLEKSLRSFSRPEEIAEFLVVDQDRDNQSASKIQSVSGRIKVLAFPVNEEQIAELGHDHAQSLNNCMQIEYSTDHIVIFDSDCFPINSKWLEKINEIIKGGYEAIVSRDPSKFGLSHPCFMVLPVESLQRLDFSEGLMEVGIDTGRLIGYQLHKMGYKVYWSDGKRASSRRGNYFYLDGSVYHHGSASFISSTQNKISSQVNFTTEEFFRKKVARGEFRLTALERFYLNLIKLKIRFFSAH
jgi:hypothetical protein